MRNRRSTWVIALLWVLCSVWEKTELSGTKKGILEATVKGGRGAGIASREGNIRKTKPSLRIICLVSAMMVFSMTLLPHASLLSLEKYSLANMS